MKKHNKLILAGCLLTMGCFLLTGCGSTDDSTSGNNTSDTTTNSTDASTDTNTGNNAGNDVGNAIGDVADGVGDAVEDIGDGIGNAVTDITSGFTNYSDAQGYFMNRMRGDNANAQYELRDENEELTAYDGDTKGYHFQLYDTATDKNGTKVGDYYLEPESGKVFHKDDSGKFVEYKFKNNQ